MKYKHLPEQVKKTGFVLENRIAQQLRAARWTVISNRYYVDDAEESVREIDLVAYQASRVQHFDVYTTLIISCKKSDTNLWGLYSREIDLRDPNSDWQPLHAWSNDKALAFKIAELLFASRYHEAIAAMGVTKPLQTPEVEVFAFQELNKNSGAPQNDKAIFQAVTSLMKAQAYELGALPQRKKTPAVYQFNLVNIFGSELVRLMFVGSDIQPTPVDQEHYIARYIIRKRETFSRIRFIRADAFADILPEYGALHSANCRWFAEQYNGFFESILKDTKRTDVFADEFRKKVHWPIRWELLGTTIKPPDSGDIRFYWASNEEEFRIYAPWGAEGAEFLNSSPKVKEEVRSALAEIYKYSGPFVFEDDDIPF